MNIQIEKELKVLVSKNNFNKFLNSLQIDKKTPRIQHNTYYDTINQDLKQLQTAIRLRRFPSLSYSEWTLKQAKNQFESLETTQIVNKFIDTIPNNLNTEWISSKEILTFLDKHHIDLEQLRKTFNFTTHRYVKTMPFGEFNLDITFYYDQVDYEIELETKHLEEATIKFKKILTELNIPLKKAPKKIARVARAFNLNHSS